jgi:cytochrome P450
VQFTGRSATVDLEVAGEQIPRGVQLVVLIAGANRDPDVFENPDVLDIGRTDNRHLAFGGGVHRCLGSHLARLELRVALEQLHERIPDYAIKPGAEPKYSVGIRAVEYLPLVFTPPPQ